jgi:hypothetical protein
VVGKREFRVQGPGFGVERSEQSGVDGGGGLAVELLVDDGLGEGFEGGLLGGEAHGERAGAGDERGEFGVGGREVRDGVGGRVRELAAALGRVGHRWDCARSGAGYVLNLMRAPGRPGARI